MDLPKLQTTLTGSLPKPAWLCEPLQLWSPWRLEGDVLKEGQQDAVRLVLRDQEKAGIDIVSDGEQTRQHFVTTDHIETPEEVAATLRNALRFVEPEKLFPCTNCGMVPLSRSVAVGKLNALAAGAAIVRKEVG